MKFEAPAGINPIDRGRVVGVAHDRIDGPAKVCGTAPYAYERHDAAPDAAYGHMLGSAIAKGRIAAIDTREAEAAPGVLGVVTYRNAGKLGKAKNNSASLLAGPEIQHYDQAVALVIAETFEQARDAAHLIRVDYARGKGAFVLADTRATAKAPDPFFGTQPDTRVGDFAGAFSKAAVKIDATYVTPDQSHQMMEPFATIAAWNGAKLTLWTANQLVDSGVTDMATTLGIPKSDIRMITPYIGGGFGAKLWLRADALLAALGARLVKRPVKVAIARPQIANNSVHRPATIQRVRLGASRDGRISAVAHDTLCGNLPGGSAEYAGMQTRLLYAGENRQTTHLQSHLDLPEGNAMRAPGEAAGMLAIEVAMDELAEACGIDPVELRIINDVQFDPEKGPSRPFSGRRMVDCLREGASRFGWSRRNPRPGQVRDGRWLVGMGVAGAIRNNAVQASGARVRVEPSGRITVFTDMTDIGTGSYTILAQTAAEMLGVTVPWVDVKLGDSLFPVSSGSGGQWGGNCSASGVYAACVKLREALAAKAGIEPAIALFENGRISGGGRSVSLGEAAGPSGTAAEDKIEFGKLTEKFAQAGFGAHFVEVGVDMHSGETRIRRMLGVFHAGRIINPKAARNQLLGGMTMGAGAALMEELVVDPRFGYFVNHDLAEYHVPVHADIPDQDIVILDDLDDKSSPMKAKGVGELGICGAGAAVANAVYNACGVRVREYPITLDKLLPKLPAVT